MTTSFSKDFIGWEKVIERRKPADEFLSRFGYRQICFCNSGELMALKTAIGRGNIPRDVIELTESEAIAHQKRLVQKWPSQSDVLFLRYGHYMAGATSFFSTAVIANYFRRFFNIKFKAYLLPFVPALLLPGLASTTLSEMIVTNNTLLMKLNCPVCKQLKCSLSQVTLGVVTPSLMAFTAGYHISQFWNLKAFPPLSKHPIAFWKQTFELFKRGTKTFQVLGLIHIIEAVFLPYMQNKEFLYISTTVEDNDEIIKRLKLFI